jgi:hypothetical protein
LLRLVLITDVIYIGLRVLFFYVTHLYILINMYML